MRAIRLFLVAAVLAVTTLLGFGAQPAGAVCGGGEPGEPCHCPEVPEKLQRFIQINC